MKEQFIPFPIPTPEEMKKIQEDAWIVHDEVDEISPIREDKNITETADLVIKKKELLEDFRTEWEKSIEALPEGKQPTMQINEKAIANMYAAGHIFNKDFSMKHIVECMINGEEVTDKIDYPQAGSRYFKLENPTISPDEQGKYIGLAGRFVIPKESGTKLAEYVANWNQKCEYKFRHGKKVTIIKKRDIPQWLIKDFEKDFYVILCHNEIHNPQKKETILEAADGPTSQDPEGDWLISTVHFGEPSRRKPRPPKELKEPNWNNPDISMKEVIEYNKETAKYNKEVAKYLKALDSWMDEQERVVFIDLEEKGVGQQGIKQETRINDSNVAELVHENEVHAKMISSLNKEINTLKAEIKGMKTRMKK